MVTVIVAVLVKVLALKERVEKEQGEAYPVAGQKLIYAGMFLSFWCCIINVSMASSCDV